MRKMATAWIIGTVVLLVGGFAVQAFAVPGIGQTDFVYNAIPPLQRDSSVPRHRHSPGGGRERTHRIW